MKEEFIFLMQEMADLTKPECSSCRAPYSCCSSEYCDFSREYAKEKWGVELVSTGHPTLPFMGEDGCIVLPHLRPWCTLHTCAVNNLGFKFGDPEWNNKYFNMRDKIDTLMSELD